MVTKAPAYITSPLFNLYHQPGQNIYICINTVVRSLDVSILILSCLIDYVLLHVQLDISAIAITADAITQYA